MDASALIAYLRGEDGSGVVEQLLLDASANCCVHAVNICEVFYEFVRAAGPDVAHRAVQDLDEVGLVVREDMDADLWQQAGALKAHSLVALRNRMSLADAFGLALAKRLEYDFVTSDHRELDAIAESGDVRITFFR